MAEEEEFGCSEISDVQCEEMCESIKNNIQISTEYLKFSDAQFEKIANAYYEAKNVSNISFNYGEVNLNQMSMITKCILKHKDTLRFITFQSRSFTNAHANLLAPILQVCSVLQGLYIYGDKLGDDGLDIICGAISNHPTLIQLDIGGDDVTDKGLKSIACVAATMPKLETLYVESCENVTKRAITALSELTIKKQVYVKAPYRFKEYFVEERARLLLYKEREIEVIDCD